MGGRGPVGDLTHTLGITLDLTDGDSAGGVRPPQPVGFTRPDDLAGRFGLRVAAGVAVSRPCTCAGTAHHECAVTESAARHRSAGTWALSPELRAARDVVERLYAVQAEQSAGADAGRRG